MKIINVIDLKIPEIKLIQFERFKDHRGYFTETFRMSDLANYPASSFSKNFSFVQGNESFSCAKTIRGLHFQWNPFMGKIVRTVYGHMIDIVLDIRKKSKTYGMGIMVDMKSNQDDERGEWIWIPPGFAHGNCFLKNTLIEYLCTGEYSQGCEAGISPLSRDIDWQLCDSNLKNKFNEITETDMIITEKDRNAISVTEWNSDPRSEFFMM